MMTTRHDGGTRINKMTKSRPADTHLLGRFVHLALAHRQQRRARPYPHTMDPDLRRHAPSRWPRTLARLRARISALARLAPTLGDTYAALHTARTSQADGR